MVGGFAGRVKPAGRFGAAGRTAKGTLLLSDPWLADVGEKPGVGRATAEIGVAGLAEAEAAVHGEPHLGSVRILLAVILPPADGAQTEGSGSFQRLTSAAGAAKACCDRFHIQMDENCGRGMTRMPEPPGPFRAKR